MEFYSDRSRTLRAQSCPRLRYLEYHVPTGGEVDGVRPERLDMNLVVGSAFHAGVAELLSSPQMASNLRVEWAVGVALEGRGDWKGYWPLVKASGLVLEEKEDASYVYHEQAALVEALIRGYGAFVLPQLLERFTAVEVEKEDLGKFVRGDFILNFGARTDALLLEKETNDLYILSLKTAKEWGKKDEDQGHEDMQGMSETAVVEQRLKEWHEFMDAHYNKNTDDFSALEGPIIPDWFIARYLTGALPQIMGVKMEYALKGRRAAEPYGSGNYKFSNPLIRPWKKADDLRLGGPAYAFKYEFQDEYGGNHRLGKGWNRVNIWEDIGVKAWIEMLATESIQGFPPGAGIEGQFVLPIEYYRNQQDIERWERQVVAQEKRFAEGLVQIKEGNYSEEKIDEHFPMHTRNCNWPTKCPMKIICYGIKQHLTNPIDAGGFTTREPNHRIEADLNKRTGGGDSDHAGQASSIGVDVGDRERGSGKVERVN